MSPELQTVLWGLAVLAPLVLNLVTNRRVDAVGVSAMLLGIWLLSRLFWVFDTPPASMQWYAPVDLIAGVTVFMLWRLGGQAWKLTLALSFLAQVALHTTFWAAWVRNGGWSAGATAIELLRRYMAFNNVIFTLQLVCAISPGGRRVAVLALARMPRRIRARHHARA